MPRPKVDMLGHRSGRLAVIAAAPSRGGAAYWRCRCDCGTEIEARGNHLRTGNVKSCGCLPRDNCREVQRLFGHRHGGVGTAEYYVWQAMKQRCLNPSAVAFPNYGGRGIGVCERWRESFAAFLEDMGRRPSPRHSLERVDNDGDYEPSNCRWATAREQMRNTSRNRLLTFAGRTMSVVDWANATGLTESTLRNRLHRGWNAERALSEPLH